MELTLFSSDSSSQYKKDIYNVIAAPYNSEYRFRYRAQYIDSQLHAQLEENALVGAKTLLMFRTNSDKAGIESFMVPIRWATIKKTYFSNEICIIDFVINDYPEFSQEFKEASISKVANQNYSEGFFSEGERKTKYVLNYIPNVVTRAKCDYDRQEYLWISIIQALRHYATFSNTSFFRTLLPKNKKEIFPKSLKIKESQYKEIELWHFCSEDTKSKISNVEIQYDANYLNSVLGTKDCIECRYDRVTYGFQALKGEKGLKSQITFRVTSLDENRQIAYDTETKICIPVILQKKIMKNYIRALITFVGSVCLVAFTSLIALKSSGIPDWAFIAMLIIGAIAPSVSWLMSGGE